jgi:hypothetical protein
MNTDSIALLCGVVLISVGCGLLVSLKAGGAEAGIAMRVHWTLRIVAVLFGVALVAPYIFGAWGNSFWYARLFSRDLPVEVNTLILYFDSDHTKDLLTNSNLERVTVEAQEESIENTSTHLKNSEVLWSVTSSFRRKFRTKPSIIAAFSEIPSAVSANRLAIEAKVNDDLQSYVITIHLWPENPATFDRSKLDKIQFGVSCIATE